jgi:hypothetical protein
MKLSDRLDKALARHNLMRIVPPTTGMSSTPSIITPVAPTITTTYDTVSEGLQNLHKHNTDDDGIGSFTAQNLGINKIQLPMVVGEYVVEDIQRAKTGIIQVQFRKSQ